MGSIHQSDRERERGPHLQEDAIGGFALEAETEPTPAEVPGTALTAVECKAQTATTGARKEAALPGSYP